MSIALTDDHVIRVPDGVDGWSENLFFLPYDFEKNIGVAMHRGRSREDPRFWREFTNIYLPDGKLLTAKAFGRCSDTDTKNSAQGLTFECVEPFKRWRATFDGMMRMTSVEEPLPGPIIEGPWVQTQYEFEFTCMFDTPWQAHTTPKAPGGAFSGTGSFHYEHVCISTGTVTIDGETTKLSCRGFRDHTRGIRKFAARSGHTLTSCSFDDGLIAGFYQERALDGTPNFNQGFTVRNTVCRTTPKCCARRSSRRAACRATSRSCSSTTREPSS